MLPKISKVTVFMLACGFLFAGFASAGVGNGGNFSGGQSAASVATPGSKAQHSKGSWENSRRHHYRHGWQHHHKGMFFKGLTDDQRKQLKENWQKQMQDMKSVRQQVKSNQKALDSQLTAAAPDMKQIDQLQAQLKNLQAQMDDHRLNSILAVRKILSPDQFQRFLKFRQKHKFLHHGMKAGAMHRHGHWGHARKAKDCDCEWDRR